MCFCPAVRDHESGLVTSSYCCALWVQVLLWRNVNQWIYYSVDHNCFGLLSALLKTFLFKGSHHCCDAASVVVVIGDKSSSAALNSFQLSYVDVCMWVPNSCCIFKLGPDKCLVASFLDMLWTGRQISAEKNSCIIGLISHCVHMSIEERLSLIRTPRYFAFLVCPSSLPWMM